MFVHLRYLAAACLLIMIAGAVLIGLNFKDYKEKQLVESTTKQLEGVMMGYQTTVWSQYAATLTTAPVVRGVPQTAYLGNFASATKWFFDKQPITKITIFSPSVTTNYYGSSSDFVTQKDGEPVRLFDAEKMAAAKTASRLQSDVQFKGDGNSATDRIMVQAIIPIFRVTDITARTLSTTPDAFAEIYVDVTNTSAALAGKLHLFIGGALGMFALLMVVLLVTAGRAESIITKQHEVNLELIAAAAQAEAQSRDKSQFLASVSHELRTPLNAIIGFSEIIRNEARDKLEKVYQDYIDDIHASGKHLLSLINDILDYSKAEAGKLQIEWAETDATKIIRNSLRMMLPRAETAQVTLVEDIPTQHLVAVTDAKKLKQVLLNLLSNAVKFTPAGGEVRCHAWMDILTGALSIQVRDTGIGIAPKDISRVMTPFGQVDSALSRKYEGTGLGLPLSKKFVESMGGEFTIESQIKVGTSVTITIPKAPPGWGTSTFADPIPAKEQQHVTPTQDAS